MVVVMLKFICNCYIKWVFMKNYVMLIKKVKLDLWINIIVMKLNIF